MLKRDKPGRGFAFFFSSPLTVAYSLLSAMNSLLILAILCVVMPTALANAFPSVVGTFMGMADWYEFKVDVSKPMGGEVANYQQKTRLVFTEQEGRRPHEIAFAFALTLQSHITCLVPSACPLSTLLTFPSQSELAHHQLSCNTTIS